MDEYNDVCDEMYKSGLDYLIGEFYKVLELYEDKNETLSKYIDSFLYEFRSRDKIVIQFNNNPYYIKLLSTLESIADDVLFDDFENHEFIKSEIFKCISIVNKMKVGDSRNG